MGVRNPENDTKIRAGGRGDAETGDARVISGGRRPESRKLLGRNLLAAEPDLRSVRIFCAREKKAPDPRRAAVESSRATRWAGVASKPYATRPGKRALTRDFATAGMKWMGRHRYRRARHRRRKQNQPT